MPPPTFATAMPSSSPHSSEAATHHDTPHTNYTAFSPEIACNTKETTGNQPKFNLKVAVAAGTSGDGDDVFLVAPTPTSARSQLSPTAASFTPRQFNSARSAHVSATSVTSYLSTGSGQTIVGGVSIGRVPSRAAHAPRSGAYETIGTIGEPATDVQELADAFGRVAIDNTIPQRLPEPYLQDVDVTIGTFTTDEDSTRAMMVTGVGRNVYWLDIAQAFASNRFPSQKGINAAELASQGVFVMNFGDVRDAKQAFRDISCTWPEWYVLPMSPKQYAAHFTHSNPTNVTNYEGQVLVTIYFDGRTQPRLASPVMHLLQQALFTCGAVKALHSLPTDQGTLRDFRVEYFDVSAAETALQSLNESIVGDFMIHVERFTPDLALLGPDPAGRPREHLSMTGRSTVPADEHDRQMNNIQPYVEDYYSRQDRHENFHGLNGNHNQVVIGRIQHGVDVRTTIMLRNIPNKIDQGMLKAILDETSHGCYDFMYLRIDFANNCNVGYAFINFTDALAIIPFALARAGQRWNKFNSDKVAEISYATIQGKDCLVQKFRNSSVMLEHPTFRPKLYTTGSGSDAGKEEKFPGPDNPSKMRRSVENAEHVGLFPRSHKRSSPKKSFPNGRCAARGALPPAHHLLRSADEHEENPFVENAAAHSSRLFAPREGQIFRDQQKNRRSQWDNGTLAGQLEAYNNRLHDPARSPTYTTYRTSYPNLSTRYHATYNTSFGTNRAGPSDWYERRY